jgi:peptidoglycan hydrolase-like protein with peptidoglycan-binding domain
MRRARFLVGAGAASVVLVAGGAAVAVNRLDDGAAADDDPSSAAPTATAEVTRRNLEEREELDGTLGFGDTSAVNLPAGGTITALPALGSTIDRGETLVEVDGKPVPLLFGARPLWRPLDANATDGPDVQQLEENLVALGYATADNLTVDQDWTSATTAAVKRWQEALGRDETGAVSTSDVVVLPGAVRVSEWPTPVGGPASGQVLTVTGTAREVSVSLEATRQTLVAVGDAVEVELPDGGTTAGTITGVGTVAEGQDEDGDGSPDSSTVDVTVTLDDAAAGGSMDSAPVVVRVVTSAATDVLAVPVDALLARSDGSYVVEKVGRDDRTTQVAVETGAFADGWVEVTGDLAEGDEVVVPE